MHKGPNTVHIAHSRGSLRLSSHPFNTLQSKEVLWRGEKSIYVFVQSCFLLQSRSRELCCHPEPAHHTPPAGILISAGGPGELATGMEFNKHCLHSIYMSICSPYHPRDQLTTNPWSLDDTFLSLSKKTLKGKCNETSLGREEKTSLKFRPNTSFETPPRWPQMQILADTWRAS